LADFLAGVFFAGAFLLGVAMIDPHELNPTDTTKNEGLGEFLHVWIAYCAIVILIPGVFCLAVCAAAGAIFAMIIDPWRAGVYLGAFIQGIKKTLQGCAMGVLDDGA
jgi:hypothetical protein